MRWIVGIGLGVAVAASVSAKEKAPLVFPDMGYSIQPLEQQPAKPQVMQHLFMFVPGEHGFAGNVGVQLQPYPGTLKAYAELSKKQFEQMKVKVLRSEVKDTHALFEYQMKNAQGAEMHVYSKAYQRESTVYLVSGTTLESSWEKQGAAIKNSVDSFSLLPRPATAK